LGRGQLSPIERVSTQLLLADFYLAQSQWTEAEQQLGKSEGNRGDDNSVPVAYTLELNDRLAQVYFELGRYDEARTVLLQAVKSCRENGDGNNRTLARALVNLGECELELGLFADAEKYFGEAEELMLRELGPSHAQLPAVRRGLARALEAQGKYDVARKKYELNLEFYKSQGGVEFLQTMQSLAHLCVSMGDHQQARAYLKDMRPQVQKVGGVSSESHVIAYLTSGTLHYAMGDYPRSEKAFQFTLKVLDQLKTPPPGLRSQVLLALGDNYAQQNRLDEAEQSYTTVLDEVTSELALASRSSRRLRADALLRLCRITRQRKENFPKASEYAQQAVELYKQCLPENHPVVATAHEELRASNHANEDYSKAAEAR
jgi:tetratricopeptide (TPR) repeat protein